jgi:hypothetical protein
MDMPKKPFPWRLDAGQIEVVDEDVAAILRKKSPAERVAMASDAHHTATLMLVAQVRAHHPDWTNEQIQKEVARRLTRGAS